MLVGGLWHLQSSNPGYRCLGWLAAACVAYQVGLFFSLMVVGYRFNLPCVVVALCIAAIAVADGLRWLRARWAVHEARTPVVVEAGQ